MNKVMASAVDAVRDIPDGATILAGGFGLPPQGQPGRAPGAAGDAFWAIR